MKASSLLDESVRVYNGCLEFGFFPDVWKEGFLRTFLKGNRKDPREAKSYRLICLLSVIGKAFEKLSITQLQTNAMSPEKLSSRQFGFMAERLTRYAIVELRRMADVSQDKYTAVVLFDISGAFDNVWWPLIFDGLQKNGCPKNIYKVILNYFENRKVKIQFNFGIFSSTASSRHRRTRLGTNLSRTMTTFWYSFLHHHRKD